MDSSFICGSFGNVVEGCLYSPQGARGEVKSVFNTLTSQQIWPLNISQFKQSQKGIKCKRPQQELTNLKFSQFNIHAWLVERYSRIHVLCLCTCLCICILHLDQSTTPVTCESFSVQLFWIHAWLAGWLGVEIYPRFKIFADATSRNVWIDSSLF